jgi:hypothetical protein
MSIDYISLSGLVCAWVFSCLLLLSRDSSGVGSGEVEDASVSFVCGVVLVRRVYQ